MALQISSQDPTIAQCYGAYSPFATGITTGSGTTTTVVVEDFERVDGVVAMSGSGAAAAPWLTTTSGNSFTVTHTSGDELFWIAWGIPRF